MAETTFTAANQGQLGSSGQTRMAYLLATLYKDKLIHVHGLGWHHWDGQRWALDETGVARRAVLKVLKSAWNASFGDPETAKDVRACMSSGAQNGVLEIASNLEEFSVSVSELDADPFKLNAANGTLDLLSGELLPHDPTDRITKVARAAFDPEADSTEWETFLTRVLPDSSVREYLRRFVGLSLLGVVREHVLGIATGTGANGKGTFYGAVRHALGDYSHAAENDLFMTVKTNANAASPAVLGLRGTRFVVCSETEEGQHLAAALMKNLTGGDPITARALHKMPVTFEPSHTALMVTNFLPKVKGNDPALWRSLAELGIDRQCTGARAQQREEAAGNGDVLHEGQPVHHVHHLLAGGAADRLVMEQVAGNDAEPGQKEGYDARLEADEDGETAAELGEDDQWQQDGRYAHRLHVAGGAGVADDLAPARGDEENGEKNTSGEQGRGLDAVHVGYPIFEKHRAASPDAVAVRIATHSLPA